MCLDLLWLRAKRFREQHVWVLGTSFILPFFASIFVASKPIKDTNFPSFSATKQKKGTKHRKWKKTKRKDDLNQLSINEINALQAKQSNWGEKKSLFIFLFLFFIDVNACAASSSFSQLCSSHFVTSKSILPEMSWWQNHNSRSLKDKFNTLSSKLNHSLDRILH